MSAWRVGAVLCALLGCTRPGVEAPVLTPPTRPAAVSSAAAHARRATPNEELVLRGLARDTERLRGLRFLRPVAMFVEDREGMRGYLRDALNASDITRTRNRYVALGFFPAELDVSGLLETLLQDELVGYYDARTKRLVVRDQLAAALTKRDDPAAHALRETIVHELTHALQDQHLGLSDALHTTRTTDEENAYAALVEGDAQLLMLSYALEARGTNLDALLADEGALTGLVRGAPDALSAAMRAAPALVREPLLFRYREGARFAAMLYQRGGFAALDAAHHTPPRTTASLLLAHAAPARALSVPGNACLAEHGWSTRDEDTLGALELSVALADGPAARRVLAESWRGDRYAVLGHEGNLAAIWRIALDSPRSAARISGQLAALAGARVVAQHGAELLVLRGVPEACAQAIALAFRKAHD